ncbi:hypothetical protein Golomagni_04917 [Golovinomyces magnicellulatus]|nr:hypothetical protein Golomagni_04917 [Golovinomyces magnicellulatus]
MSIQVPMSAKSKAARTVLAVVAKQCQEIPPHSRVVIKITTTKSDIVNLLDHDMIFEPAQKENLVGFVQLVSGKCEAIIMEKSTDQFIFLLENQKLGEIIDYNAEAMTVVDETDVYHLAQVPSKIFRLLGETFGKECVSRSCKIHGYDSVSNRKYVFIDDKSRTSSKKLMSDSSFPELWNDDGNFAVTPLGEELTIELMENWETKFKLGQAKIYPAGKEDRELIDDAFNKLHDKNRLYWTKLLAPFSFSVFVIWKKYFVKEGKSCKKVKDDHQHRLTVATHRGQETSRCAVIGFRNSPTYVQRRIDIILRTERAFARSYIDDVVIFNRTFEEHFEHLRAVFQKLRSFKIFLSAKKCFLDYPSMGLFGQRVDALGLASAEDKIKATHNLEFPRTLEHLEYYLGLTGYLRQYVPPYAKRSAALQQIKVKMLRELKEKENFGKARWKLTSSKKSLINTCNE